jgi:hypothetical protein
MIMASGFKKKGKKRVWGREFDFFEDQEKMLEIYIMGCYISNGETV